ncbi:Glycosyltransferase involved in cell wall bisynthesis [Selenomonas ruminantium]|uniref:Glycosyltransferase involved in cell wall bisynthesis n=1 Tax=Selenomonas ruminantium TaxID=971 RepID=A0A1I3FNN1_SELRU|nr:glycosyltransferase [Selenomonas ruminantium]SFI12766.1 Glycosyltransferase involved in cell wall bisynthesis [Selenomonas ruminantium]
MVMKKIIFVIRSLAGGGAERVMLTLAKKFSKDGLHPIIIVFENIVAYDIPEGCDLILLKSKFNNRILRDIWWMKQIRSFCKQSGVIALISFLPKPNIYSIVSSAFLKHKVIISERNDPRRNASLKIDLLRKFFYPFADKIVFQTEEAKDYFNYINPGKCLCIPNPINSNLIDPYFGKRRKEFVNFCRFNNQKNLFLLIDSFKDVYKYHPDYHLSIYGEGELEDKLRQYIAEHSLEKCCMIKKFTKNIHEVIKDATCYVSSSDYEGISNSMLEAMAIGLPVICTDCPCGGARMIIRSYKNGILVKVGSKTELVKAMLWVISHQDEANKIAIEAINIRETLNENSIYIKWKKIVF